MMELVPRVDFRLFSFGFNHDNFLDASGPRREQVEVADEAEEPQPSTQVPPPSGLSLDDLLIPDGMGALEQISYYHIRKIIEPQFPAISYLFFDSAQPGNFLSLNPEYLIYTNLIPYDTTPYAKGYSHFNSIPIYSAEAQYENVEQPKSHLQTADYPTPFFASASLLDSREQGYARANSDLFASNPGKESDFVYEIDYVQFAQPATLPIFAQAKSTKIVQPLYPSALLFYHVKSKPQIDLSSKKPSILTIPQTEQLPQKLTTLDEYVESIYINPKIISDRPFYIHITPSFYQKTQTTQKYDTSPSNKNLNPQQILYYLPEYMQQTSPPKINILNFARIYDTHPQWINVLSSNFWQASPRYLGRVPIKQNNVTVNEYRQESSKPQEDETGDIKIKYAKKEQHWQHQDKQEPSSEIDAEIKPLADKEEEKDESKQIKPRYETKKRDETQEKEVLDSNVKTDYQLNNNKKSEEKEDSALTYIGAAAGIGLVGGLVGLSKLISLPSRLKSKTKNSQQTEYQTIDSVVTLPTDNETAFPEQFRTELTSIINEAKQLGYGFFAMTLIKNSTNEYLGIGEDKKPKPAASINKVAIAFAAGYLAQQGILKLDKDTLIDFDPEIDKDCILAREIERYPIFKEKGKISYDYLRSLMLRESVNTSGNIIEKYIGNENKKAGQRAVERIMAEIGLNDIKISDYLPDGKYLDGVTSTENAARLQSYIAQGKYLKPEYLNPIKEDLENESHLEFERNKLGVKAATKITFLKEGTGFALHFDDYSGAVLFNDIKKPLWTDEAKDAMSIRKYELDTMSATRNLFGKIFDTLQKYLVEPKYTYRKAA